MKRYAKILSVLLCLVLLISVINMVAAAQGAESVSTENNSIKQGAVYERISPKRLTTSFGYYWDGTGDNEYTFVDCGEGKYLTDGWYGRAGASNCTHHNGQIAAIINVDQPINFGRIEIVANDNGQEGWGDIIDFDIQAWVNGAWVEVASERGYIFPESRSAIYTFEAVKTAKVRILIHGYYERQPMIKEVTLFEKKVGDLKKTINLIGGVAESDAGDSYLGNCLVDNNKATAVTLTDAVVDVDTTGKGIAIDGFVLYPCTADGAIPGSITISVLTVGGERFEEIGTYQTGWGRDKVLDPLVVTFDEPYVVTALVVNIDTGAVSEFELFQYEWEIPIVVETEPPTTLPTEPPTTKPTQAPTKPTEAPTKPTEAPTKPTEAPTNPTEAPTDPTDPTDPTEPIEPTEPTEPTDPIEPTEPTDPEATEPEVTDPEATEPEVTDPEATEPEATEPEATEPKATEPKATEPEATQAPTNAPSNNKDAAEAPKSSVGLIIGIVAAVVVIGTIVFFVIKKKKV